MRTAFIVLAALAAPAHADVRLPAIIGPNMVLQAETAAPLWGWADPGEEITVTASWPGAQAARATAAPDGEWSLELATPGAGGPYSITVAGGSTVTLENVLVGEVWLASGQSNMEWPLRATDDASAAIGAADHPEIRLFVVQNTVSAEPREDCVGRWVVCSPQTAADFSAVAYYFGRELHTKLGPPVGLIASEWGGTPAESWTSAESLAPFPRHAPGLELMRLVREDPDALEREHQRALADWQARYETAEQLVWTKPEFDDSGWETMNEPGGWNRELQSFDGAVWYRREVTIPAEWAGRELVLSLGPIDDEDVTSFNGRQVGAVQDWTKPRTYAVPAELVQPGRAVIAVSVLDTNGAGGFYGEATDMYLAPRGHAENQRSFLAGPWRYKIGRPASEIPPRPQKRGINAHTPSALYNGMIAPLVPYAIRGAIWYQGESNRGAAYEYRTLFPAMIADWRGQWEREFPFYFVQIAPFTYGGDRGETAELREAQLLTSLHVPNTGMVVTMDIGDPRDIHPRNKLDVGQRLALWALARTYGQTGFEHAGPVYESITTEGSTLVLRFGHAEGLHSRGGVPKGFEIAGEDRVWHAAGAIIEGDTAILSAYGVERPVAARYGWDDADEPNLFNGAGLPASPFRTDDWERVTRQ